MEGSTQNSLNQNQIGIADGGIQGLHNYAISARTLVKKIFCEKVLTFLAIGVIIVSEIRKENKKMDLVIFVLGILYLCGMEVATPLAWCCVIFGVAKIVFTVIDNT